MVSLSTTGTNILIPVFVEFQISTTSFPPVENTAPVLKSLGDVLSKTTQLELVVLFTPSPTFPAESEIVKLKVTNPSESDSVNWYIELNSDIFTSVMFAVWV